jgi:hypothetical protein
MTARTPRWSQAKKRPEGLLGVMVDNITGSGWRYQTVLLVKE